MIYINQIKNIKPYPILMAYPDAEIYCVTDNGLQLIDYEDTEQYKLSKYFVNNYHKIIDDLGLT